MGTVLQERIRERLAATGQKARGASLAAGLGPDAIRTILDGRSLSPRAERLQAIAAALQCDVRYLLGVIDMPFQFEGDEELKVAEELTQLPPRFGRRPKLAQLQLLPIRDRVQAGAWLAMDENNQIEPKLSSTVRDPRYPSVDQWLSEVMGDSMNALGIFEGDLVHIVELIGSGWYPRTGDIVEVERIRFDGAERELTIKQVEVTGPNTALLWPRSTNPRWSEPLSLGSDEEGLEVRIRGFMINLVRRYA
jgi:SOS-response transcriptional repressor LexA